MAELCTWCFGECKIRSYLAPQTHLEVRAKCEVVMIYNSPMLPEPDDVFPGFRAGCIMCPSKD